MNPAKRAEDSPARSHDLGLVKKTNVRVSGHSRRGSACADLIKSQVDGREPVIEVE